MSKAIYKLNKTHEYGRCDRDTAKTNHVTSENPVVVARKREHRQLLRRYTGLYGCTAYR